MHSDSLPDKSAGSAATHSARLGPMNVQLVVTDLDGTFWHLANEVHPRTLDAVSRLHDAGIPMLVATGRRVRSTRDPLEEVGLAPPAVVLNGALGLDLATGERFHEGGFTVEDAVLVLDAFRAHGIDPCIYVDQDDGAVFVSPDPSTHPDHLAGLGSDARVGDLSEVARTERVLGFSVLGISEARAAALGDSLAGIGTPHVDRDRYYGDFAVTVAPVSNSKWDGVAAFCSTHDVDPASVVALGDGPNDVELLVNAGLAAVPEDAHPSALAHADHVIGRARDGGWAEILDLI